MHRYVMHLCSGQHTSPIAERQLACSVSLQDGTPLLHVVESCAMPEHGGITLRKYAIHSVDDDTAQVAAQRPTSGKSQKMCCPAGVLDDEHGVR